MNQKILDDIKLKLNKTKKNFIAIHGPQGCGKTSLSKFLEKRLSEDGYNVVKMSLDDFYYGYDKMKNILNEFFLFQSDSHPMEHCAIFTLIQG